MKKTRIKSIHSILTLLALATIFMAQLPLRSIGQVRKNKDNQRTETFAKNGLKSRFTVWTELSQRDLQSALPRGSTVRSAGRNGFLVDGITDHIRLAVNLGVLSAQRGVPTPRFGLEGQGDPGETPRELHDLGLALGSIIAVIVQNANNLAGGKWPKGPIRDPNEVWGLLDGTGLQKQPVVLPPNPSGKGRWVRVCEPTGPCNPPAEPEMEDVDQCNDEKREIKRVQRWLDAYDSAIAKGQELYDKMKTAQSIKEGIDITIGVLTVVAISTGPLGAAAGFAFAAGALAVNFIQGFLIDKGIDAYLDLLKGKIDELKRKRALFALAMAEARAALEACLKKAAETEAANAAAWDKFFNVDLPAYYSCLDARKCRWVWMPE